MPKLGKAALDERRQHILGAALVCFARDGFHRATIADVCKEAGVSTGAVYVYFPNKEAIVRAILQEAQALRQAQLRAADASRAAPHGGEPERVLLQWVEAIFTSAGQDAARIDVNLWSEAVCNPRIAKIASAALSGAVGTVRDVIAARRPGSGPLRGLDPDAVAAVLVSVFLGLEVQTAVGLSIDGAEVLRVLTALVSPNESPPADAGRTASRARSKKRA